VREILPPGNNLTTPASGAIDVKLAASEHLTGQNFGDTTDLEITGSVYNDLSGVGTRQPGDPGLAGWQVYVDVNDIGYAVAGDPIATTDANGNYLLFYAPPAGVTSLIIREVRQNGWRRTQPAGIYPLGFYTIALPAISVGSIDFGDSLTSLVTGTVFNDANGNGKLDPGEAPLTAWQIEVDAYVNGVWKDDLFTTTTDSNGDYSFVLAAGTYRIHEVIQSGYNPTKPAATGYTLPLAAGATVTAENFGNKA